MTSQNNLIEEMISFKNENERNLFEVETIHLDIMHKVKKLMKKHNKNRADLASDLQTTKGYITRFIFFSLTNGNKQYSFICSKFNSFWSLRNIHSSNA